MNLLKKDEYFIRWFQLLATLPNHQAAYEQTEAEYQIQAEQFRLSKKYRYRDYDSFRVAKCNHLKLKTNR